jgi:hypothetical protein
MIHSRIAGRALRVCLYVCLGTCLLFGTGALADALVGTSFWPDGAEYGVTLPCLAALYDALLPDGASTENWRVIAVVCLTAGLISLVIAAYTDPEGPITIMGIFTTVLGVAFSLGGLSRTKTAAS